MTPTLTEQNIADIIDALAYQSEDLAYRIDGGVDYDREDVAAVQDHIDRLNDLIVSFDNPLPETEDDEYDDGKTLIAGVLYDNETLQEADPQ